MSKSTRFRQIFYFILTFLLISSANTSFSAESAVLLPVTGPLTLEEKNGIAEELANEMSHQYKLIFGEEVNNYVTKVFREESEKEDCDEEKCYERIATHYGVEKIVAFRVVQKESNNYLLTLNIYDVLQGKTVYSKQSDCLACSYSKLKGQLKEIASL